MDINLDTASVVVGGQPGVIARNRAHKGAIQLVIDVPALSPASAAGINSFSISGVNAIVTKREAFGAGSRITVDLPLGTTLTRNPQPDAWDADVAAAVEGAGGGSGGGLFTVVEVNATSSGAHVPAPEGNLMLIVSNPSNADPQIVYVKAGPVGHQLVIVRSAENATGVMAIALEDADGNLIGVLPEAQTTLAGNHDSVTWVYTGPDRGYIRVSKQKD